jgi:cysteine desulfurase
LAVHQIAGFGAACALASSEMAAESVHLRHLGTRLYEGLMALPGVRCNGDYAEGVPGILNLSFAGVEGETLLLALGELAVSSGSACNSATLAPSYVLRTIGVPDELALSAIRFSIGRFTHEKDIEFAITKVTETVTRLRRAPAHAQAQ